MVTRQLSVERRTAKARQSKTNVLPLSHGTNRNRIERLGAVICREMLWISAAIVGMRCPSVVCMSVRPSVTFVSCAKTNKDIFEIFSPSGSQAILVFPCQTEWRYSDGNPLTGASNAGGVGRNRDSERISGTYGISSMPVYRVTLIGVFLGHFRIKLHQTCTQYSNEGPQHWTAARFPKITF